MIEKTNELIAPYTHYKIGGAAREVWFPESAGECCDILKRLKESGTPYYILGGGSNVLVGDGYWGGVVVILSALKGCGCGDSSVTCGAGVLSSEIAAIALANKKTGLEFLHLLPGTIGGATAGNARFDNIGVSDVLLGLAACHPEHGIREFQRQDLDFSYKYNSLIPGDWIICEVTLGWKDGDPGKIRARMDEITRKREGSHHFDFPSAGCVFKNDHARNVQVGRLLDSLGMKGMRVGDAEIADFHANFIVNRGHATAHDVLTLIETIEREVKARTGITLDREIRLAGTFI